LAILGIDATTNQAICHIIPDDKIANTKYIYHYLQYKVPVLIGQAIGGAQPNINQQIIKRLQIYLPPLPEQQRIAAILDKADELRLKRRRALQRLDDLLQSVFLEMFGDPATNPKGWKMVLAGEIFEIKLGKMRSERYITGKYLHPYLRNLNVQWGYLDLSDIKQMDFTPEEMEKYCLKSGDILVCEGGEVGRTAIFNGEIEDCGYQNALHRLRPLKPVINSNYFVKFMRLAANFGLIQRKSSQVTISHFTAEKFLTFHIMLPPKILQDQFSNFVDRLNLQKKGNQYALNVLDNLFYSLQESAFKGEL
jgi:type I restriction enzyme S subunit